MAQETNNLAALFADGASQMGSNRNNNSTDELAFSRNAHDFFTRVGIPVSKVDHKFFTKFDGKPLEGYKWARPFFGQISSLYIGKNLAAEGFDRKKLVAELKNQNTVYEVHIRKNAREAYISKPFEEVTGDAAADFQD